MGNTAKPMNDRNHQQHRREKMHRRVGAQGNNVFLGERLDAVGNRLQNAEGTDAIGAQPILHAAQSLALQQHGDRKQRRKHADDGRRHSSKTPATACHAAGKKPTSQCWSRTKIWSSLSIIAYCSLLRLRLRGRALAAGFGCGGFGGSLRLGFGLGLLRCQPRVHRSRFGWMNLVVILVRFGQLLAI